MRQHMVNQVTRERPLTRRDAKSDLQLKRRLDKLKGRSECLKSKFAAGKVEEILENIIVLRCVYEET